MAFDTDGMRNRRKQKNEELQQRLRQQKTLIWRLVAAVAILLGCAVLIFFVPWGMYETGPQQNEQTQATVAETTDPLIRDPYTVIHIAAAGDLNVTDKLVNSGGITFDFSQMFQDVMPLLTDADYTVLNFEGILSGTPYGSQVNSAPFQVLTALTNAGVDMVQLANSKIINNGIYGLEMTIQSARNAGLQTVGAYLNKQEFSRSGGYLIQEIGGLRVAFVAFTKGLDGMALPEGSEDCVNLLYEDYASNYKKVNTAKIKRILKNVENAKPDITIALLHWGSEYNDVHNATQESIKNLMLSNGVDAIIGTHPHYVQQVTLNQDGTFVAYSLGDLISDAERSGTEYSIVLDLEITRDNITGETKVTNYTYTPIFTATQEDGTLKVVRLREAIAAYEAGHVSRVTKEEYDKMVYALSRVESRVNPEED